MTNLSKILRFYILLSAITLAAISVASGQVLDKNVPQGENVVQNIVTEETNLTNREAAINVEIDRRFNELRSKILDDKSTRLDRWLIVVIIFLTVFGLFQHTKIKNYTKKFIRYDEKFIRYDEELQDYKREAKSSVAIINKYKEDVVENATGNQGRGNISTEEVDTSKEHSSKAKKHTDDSEPPLPEDANTNTEPFKQGGTIKKEIEQWQTVAKEKEISDPEVAADAWFFVGFLFQFEDPTTSNQLSNQNAFDAYTNALRINPNHVKSYFNRGNVNANLGNHENAIRDYVSAIKIQPTAKLENDGENINMLRDLYFNSGNSYTRLGIPDYVNAIVNYDLSLANAIQSIPNHRGNIYYNRGNDKFCVGDYSGAVEDYKEAISCGTFLRDSWFNQGNSEINLGNYERALKSYDESIKVDENYKNAHSNRIVAKVALGRIDEALSDINQLIQSKSSRAGDDVISTPIISNWQIIRGNRGRKKLDGNVPDIELTLTGNVGNIGMFGGVAPSGDPRYLSGGEGFPGSPGFTLRIAI